MTVQAITSPMCNTKNTSETVMVVWESLYMAKLVIPPVCYLPLIHTVPSLQCILPSSGIWTDLLFTSDKMEFFCKSNLDKNLSHFQKWS